MLHFILHIEFFFYNPEISGGDFRSLFAKDNFFDILLYNSCVEKEIQSLNYYDNKIFKFLIELVLKL